MEFCFDGNLGLVSGMYDSRMAKDGFYSGIASRGRGGLE